MNQPSAEDDKMMMEFIRNDGRFQRAWNNGLLNEAHEAIRAICLNLPRKTEPIPGAVSSIQLSSDSGLGSGDCAWLLSEYDIYPKGTVARLMGEVEELKESIKSTLDNGVDHIKYLQSEIDRLKGENIKLRGSGIFPEPLNPESVGCDNFEVGTDALHACGGPSGFVCKSCQEAEDQKSPECSSALTIGCGEWFDTPPKLCGWGSDLCPKCRPKSRTIDAQFILDELEALVTAVKQFRRENEK